jgi:hypothetical protein
MPDILIERKLRRALESKSDILVYLDSIMTVRSVICRDFLENFVSSGYVACG